MTARRAQLLLCLALAARGVCAQNASNASAPASNATLPPPPAANASTTPAPAPPNTATSPAGGAVADEQLWLLQDNQCRRTCVETSTLTLSWCADQIKHFSFCNRTADGTSEWSVARIEEAAQSAYNAIEFGLNTPPSADCKRALHQWVCWQFFTQCGSDKRTLRPMCQSSCKALADVCVIGWLDCDIEVEELRGTAPPWWFDAGGAYIRGVKPANDSVPLASRRAVTLADNGVLGQGTVYAPPNVLCTGAGAHAAPTTALLLLLAAAQLAGSLWHDRQD